MNSYWSWKAHYDILWQGNAYAYATKNGSDASLYDYLITHLCEEEKNYDYSKVEDWNLTSMRVEK